MVAVPDDSLFALLLSDAGVRGDSESEAQASAIASTESKLSEEFDGERDLGSLDLPEYEERHERGFYHPYD